MLERGRAIVSLFFFFSHPALDHCSLAQCMATATPKGRDKTVLDPAPIRRILAGIARHVSRTVVFWDQRSWRQGCCAITLRLESLDVQIASVCLAGLSRPMYFVNRAGDATRGGLGRAQSSKVLYRCLFQLNCSHCFGCHACMMLYGVVTASQEGRLNIWLVLCCPKSALQVRSLIQISSGYVPLLVGSCRQTRLD